MRRLVLLGSTGSIGRSTLEVVDHLGDVQVVGLSARRNAEMLGAQARRYHPRAVAIEDPREAAANEVAVQLFLERRLPFGEIPTLLRRTMEAHRTTTNPTVEEILAADTWARETVTRFGVEVRR